MVPKSNVGDILILLQVRHSTTTLLGIFSEDRSNAVLLYETFNCWNRLTSAWQRTEVELGVDCKKYAQDAASNAISCVELSGGIRGMSRHLMGVDFDSNSHAYFQCVVSKAKMEWDEFVMEYTTVRASPSLGKTNSGKDYQSLTIYSREGHLRTLLSLAYQTLTVTAKEILEFLPSECLALAQQLIINGRWLFDQEEFLAAAEWYDVALDCLSAISCDSPSISTSFTDPMQQEVINNRTTLQAHAALSLSSCIIEWVCNSSNVSILQSLDDNHFYKKWKIATKLGTEPVSTCTRNELLLTSAESYLISAKGKDTILGRYLFHKIACHNKDIDAAQEHLNILMKLIAISNGKEEHTQQESRINAPGNSVLPFHNATRRESERIMAKLSPEFGLFASACHNHALAREFDPQSLAVYGKAAKIFSTPLERVLLRYNLLKGMIQSLSDTRKDASVNNTVEQMDTVMAAPKKVEWHEITADSRIRFIIDHMLDFSSRADKDIPPNVLRSLYLILKGSKDSSIEMGAWEAAQWACKHLVDLISYHPYLVAGEKDEYQEVRQASSFGLDSNKHEIEEKTSKSQDAKSMLSQLFRVLALSSIELGDIASAYNCAKKAVEHENSVVSRYILFRSLANYTPRQLAGFSSRENVRFALGMDGVITPDREEPLPDDLPTTARDYYACLSRTLQDLWKMKDVSPSTVLSALSELLREKSTQMETHVLLLSLSDNAVIPMDEAIKDESYRLAPVVSTSRAQSSESDATVGGTISSERDPTTPLALLEPLVGRISVVSSIMRQLISLTTESVGSPIPLPVAPFIRSTVTTHVLLQSYTRKNFITRNKHQVIELAAMSELESTQQRLHYTASHLVSQFDRACIHFTIRLLYVVIHALRKLRMDCPPNNPVSTNQITGNIGLNQRILEEIGPIDALEWCLKAAWTSMLSARREDDTVACITSAAAVDAFASILMSLYEEEMSKVEEDSNLENGSTALPREVIHLQRKSHLSNMMQVVHIFQAGSRLQLVQKNYTSFREAAEASEKHLAAVKKLVANKELYRVVSSMHEQVNEACSALYAMALGPDVLSKLAALPEKDHVKAAMHHISAARKSLSKAVTLQGEVELQSKRLGLTPAQREEVNNADSKLLFHTSQSGTHQKSNSDSGLAFFQSSGEVAAYFLSKLATKSQLYQSYLANDKNKRMVQVYDTSKEKSREQHGVHVMLTVLEFHALAEQLRIVHKTKEEAKHVGTSNSTKSSAAERGPSATAIREAGADEKVTSSIHSRDWMDKESTVRSQLLEILHSLRKMPNITPQILEHCAEIALTLPAPQNQLASELLQSAIHCALHNPIALPTSSSLSPTTGLDAESAGTPATEEFASIASKKSSQYSLTLDYPYIARLLRRLVSFASSRADCYAVFEQSYFVLLKCVEEAERLLVQMQVQLDEDGDLPREDEPTSVSGTKRSRDDSCSQEEDLLLKTLTTLTSSDTVSLNVQRKTGSLIHSVSPTATTREKNNAPCTPPPQERIAHVLRQAAKEWKLYPVEEADYMVVLAWNHGVFFQRAGSYRLAEKFMAWAVMATQLVRRLECLNTQTMLYYTLPSNTCISPINIKKPHPLPENEQNTSTDKLQIFVKAKEIEAFLLEQAEWKEDTHLPTPYSTSTSSIHDMRRQYLITLRVLTKIGLPGGQLIDSCHFDTSGLLRSNSMMYRPTDPAAKRLRNSEPEHMAQALGQSCERSQGQKSLANNEKETLTGAEMREMETIQNEQKGSVNMSADPEVQTGETEAEIASAFDELEKLSRTAAVTNAKQAECTDPPDSLFDSVSLSMGSAESTHTSDTAKRSEKGTNAIDGTDSGNDMDEHSMLVATKRDLMCQLNAEAVASSTVKSSIFLTRNTQDVDRLHEHGLSTGSNQRNQAVKENHISSSLLEAAEFMSSAGSASEDEEGVAKRQSGGRKSTAASADPDTDPDFDELFEISQ